MSSEITEICSWMTNEYLKSILSKYEGHDNLQLVDYSASAPAKGENFASSIYRMKLNYLISGEQKQVTLIFKTKPESGAMSEMLENMDTFASEAHIYNNVLAECEKTTDIKVAPKLLHTDNKAMVLEDLGKDGFTLANRKLRFDLQQTKAVIEKLGSFHAATAALFQKSPEVFKYHLESALNKESNQILEYFFTVSYQTTLEAVRSIPELQKFLPKLESFEAFERQQKVFTRQSDEKFHVLNHGDMWINNIFFKTNGSNEVVDCRLIDFQECFWGSPGIDLNHFLYSCCSNEVHENHLTEVLKCYHEALTKTLRELKYPDIPTFEEILAEFDRKSDQALVVAFSIIPVLMLENSDYANPELFLADTEEGAAIRAEVFGNPKFLELLKFLLPKIMQRID